MVVYTYDVTSKGPVNKQQGLKDMWRETDNLKYTGNRNSSKNSIWL